MHSDDDKTSPGQTTLGVENAARGGQACAFAPGDLIGGRYRLLRLVGEGGMGVVFEAEDLMLGERVALKAIRPEVAQDEKVVERFKREIQMARRVTHPNVCRIFDVGFHRPDQGGVPAVFLTMELLAGDTLAQRIAEGPIPVAELRPLVAQMCSALAAAHAAGVIHRDFKSANVILAPNGGRVRAVVTDFGLARPTEDTPGGGMVTGDGGIVGSPAYMAPEQVEGGKVGPVSDVYALGVVIFEALTGQVPFQGSTPLATAVKRLQMPAPEPKSVHPDVPQRWNDVVSRCLERRPADRFQCTADVVEALGVDGTTTQPVPRPRRKSWKRWALVGGLALGLVTFFAVNVLDELAARERAASGDDDDGPRTIRPRGGRPSVAVLGFRNTTGRPESAWMGSALGEMLATELAAGEKVRLVSGEAVSRARRELGVDAEVQDSEEIGRLARSLDADFLLLGSYVAQGTSGSQRVRIDLKLQDARSGDTVVSVAVDGNEAEFNELVTKAGGQLRQKMALGALSANEQAGLRASVPQQPNVARLYHEGVAEMRVEACSAARGPLEQAVAEEPSFPLAHSALAEALDCLGYEERAREEAQKAVALSENLPPQVRLQTEARWRELNHDWAEAADIYHKLYTMFPDNFDYGISLARFQIQASQLDEAKRMLAALRRLPSPQGDHPRLDLLEEMLVAQNGGSAEQRLEIIRRARTGAEKQGARLVEASALLGESRLLAAMGRPEDSVALAQEARTIYEAAGDRDGVILAMAHEAGARRRQGDQAAVNRLEEGALKIAEALGNGRHMRVFHELQASALAAQGDLEGALKAFGHLHEHAMARGEHHTAAFAQIFASLCEVELGRPAAARVRLERALQMFERWGGPTKRGKQGDVRAALVFVLAMVTAELGEPGVARSHLDDLRKLWNEGVTSQRTEDDIQLMAAQLALDTGDPRATLRELSRMRPQPAPRKLYVDALRAEALVAIGDLPGAGSAFDERSLSPFLKQNQVMRVYASILGAYVASARAPNDERGPTQQLEAAIAQAETSGMVRTALMARLTLGQLERRWGRDKALERLRTVEDDARRAGFGRIARKAKAAVSGS